ncbi:MAG: sigma 54-interacting transcriptional regulator [Desulfobacteraceae bacterium]|nr:sigma 54-interacting transcriptional regulator [Desulfobacteraceae bacterium]MBC2756572.1 sigma 54-interacting transcriptional regulator [Desulfobacteraceae bacterium]
MAKNPKSPDELKETATEIILESISDGVFTVDHNWKIMSFNRAAEEITGIYRNEAIGKHCWEVFRSNMCESDCALKKTMKEGKSFINTFTHIINSEKKQIPITVSTSLLKDKKGKIIGGVETFRDHTLVEELRKELAASYRMGDIVSASPEMKNIFNILPQIAESDSTVLIEGETGTGKELAARAIHNLSMRKENPFVTINCGALPDTLLESELFGYKAGAFTNAVKDKPGLFAIAEGGTLFLDEIGDTSAAFQARLLRVLEEKEFQPLGAVKKEKANVRVIAATNKKLSHLVEEKTFRHDLYYRINVVSLNLPPLKQRMEDILLLVEHFIAKLNRIRGKSVSGIDQQALEILMSHDFPGNIRELENIIEHAFVLCSEGDINPGHLPATFSRQSRAIPEYETPDDPVRSAEIRVIMDALKQNNYNRKAAAEDLGMHKSTLFRKIEKLGIRLPEIDGRSRNYKNDA